MLALLKAPAVAAYILAAAQGCPATKPPQLDFDFRVAKTEFVHALSPAELERLRRKNSARGPEGKLSGLTETKINHKIAIHGSETDRPDGWHCFTPVKVVVALELVPTVYIASLYRPGSCRYRQTRKHELQHVETATATVEEFAPIILAALRKAVKELRPQGPSTLKQLRRDRTRLSRMTGNAYARVVEDMTRVLEKRQARLDTPEEYRRIGMACAGEED